MKGTGIIITIVVTLGLIGLLAFLGGKQSTAPTSFYKDTQVACLTNGHQRLADHIHPILSITVDGESEPLPADIGIDGNCMSEIHTHDETGTLHLESVQPGKVQEFTLADFFTVWGTSPERTGYQLEIFVDGEQKESVQDVAFIDQSMIELRYTTITE